MLLARAKTPEISRLHALNAALRCLLIYASAVFLITGQFIRQAVPSHEIVIVPSDALLRVIVVFQVLPILSLFLIDIVLSSRPALRRAFQTSLHALVILLVFRQLELYSGLGRHLSSILSSSSELLSLTLLMCLVLMAAPLAKKFHNSLSQFLLYFSPAAVLLTLLLIGMNLKLNAPYKDLSAAEVEGRSPDKPPVFIIVFDELARQALADEAGTIDAKEFPNFARLASDSLDLTNATTNFFHTWFAVPSLIDSVLPLKDDYEVRLYEQTERISRLYASGCGLEYTCRGVRYVTTSRSDLADDLAIRGLYEALPRSLETVARVPLHWLVRRTGGLSASADPDGIHQISKGLFEVFLKDVRKESSGGKVYFFHTLLPHAPFAFDADGTFDSDSYRNFAAAKQPVEDEVFADYWLHYKEQVAFADRLLGEFLERLDKEGLYDSSVIMVTSDHGLRTRPSDAVQPLPIDTLTTRVPLLIRFPGVFPTVSNIDYQHVDFGVTLFDILGYSPKASSLPRFTARLPDPISSLAASRPPREKVFYVDYFSSPYWRYVFDLNVNSWRPSPKMTDSLDPAAVTVKTQ